MSLRRRVSEAVSEGLAGRLGRLESLLREEPRAIRFLTGMSYHSDPSRRELASKGLAIAAHYHPGAVQEVVRRLVWAMNDESGTNALTAPLVLQTIARQRPKLLLPVVPDLMRLTGDSGLRDGLLETLEIIRTACPGQVGEMLGTSLSRRLRRRRRPLQHRRRV